MPIRESSSMKFATGLVMTVSSSAIHDFSKVLQAEINILAGLGVEGDAHLGVTVKHRSRVAVDPTQPNLRQVHLIASELFAELRQQGFKVAPGDLGENMTTSGIDLISLPRGTILKVGEQAVLEVMGLRNPCAQIDNFQSGLLSKVIDRDHEGHLIRKAGIMCIANVSGRVRPDDVVKVELPKPPFEKLERV
jgi:hypothetical protein